MARFLVFAGIALLVLMIAAGAILLYKHQKDQRLKVLAQHDPKQLSLEGVNPTVQRALLERKEWMDDTSDIIRKLLEDPVVQCMLPTEYAEPLQAQLNQYNKKELNQ